MSAPDLSPANPVPPPYESPPWGSTAKLVAGLTFVTLLGALVVRFRTLVGPLLLALILSYVLHPAIVWIARRTVLPWRAAVNILFLLVVAAILTFLTVTGIAIVEQAQNLVSAVERFIDELPVLLEQLSTTVLTFGPFRYDLSQFFGGADLNALIEQALNIVQPVLGQAGSLVSSLASSTVSAFGWILFILLVSYFLLVDAGDVPDLLKGVVIPTEFDADIRRLGRSLGRIWNAFMRGQILLFSLTVVLAFIILSIMGVRNALALAFLSGGARFVPYVGPLITGSVTGIVAFLQPGNHFGLEPWVYALIVIGLLVVQDQMLDNVIAPRLYGQTLGVHPAAVLVAAIVAANLLGLIGLLLAAPVLATFLLFGRYALRKMFDQDPWPEPEPDEKPHQWIGKVKHRAVGLRQRFARRKRKK